VNATQDKLISQVNLDDLLKEAFSSIVLLAGVISTIWFVGAVILFPFGVFSNYSWLGLGVLILTVVVCNLLKNINLQAASQMLIWGILVTITCLLLGSPSPIVACLFILSIIIASALLSEGMLILVTGIASVATIAIVGYFNTTTITSVTNPTAMKVIVSFINQIISSGALVPVSIMIIVAFTSWSTSKSLHTALEWVWHGYSRSRENELLARKNQGELTRALKSLDDALYRLERANYKFQLARNQAEEARRLKQHFAQTISHELRTPLNLIVSFTELMTQSPEYYGGLPSFPYMRDLSIVYRNASHLQELVNDVLDLARIEAAQMSILPEQTDPTQLVMDAAETIRSLVEASGLTLDTKIEPNLPILWLDPTRIRQVLFNLLNNSVRFTETGGITVQVFQQDNNILFSVTDTGVGIESTDLHHIFEEFRQVDGSTRRHHGGAGLGLAISKRFIELHGGQIWVESQVGEGSSFTFSLPASEPELDAILDGSPDRSRALIKTTEREEPILLVITRSPLAVALLTRHVSSCHTVVMHNLEDAGQAIQQILPQVIVIDNSFDGLDFLNLDRLGREWGLSNTPIVVCPLPGEEPLRQRLAVDGYLLKPISKRNLDDTMRQFGQEVDRVLVIDDEQDFVLLISRFLEDNPARKYQVLSANSGEEGFSMIQQYKPDLILLDMMLPDINGIDLIERIEATSTIRDIPIVVISGQETFGEQRSSAGAMMVAKANGLRPNEVVQWIQDVLDTTVRPTPLSGGEN